MKAAAAPGVVTDLLPADQVLTGEEGLAWSRGFPAEAVVFPASPDEVRALVRVANETGTGLVPAGRGSWLWAGGWTGEGCVIVSTERLDGVDHYEPADLTLTAGAGLGWGDLDGVLRPYGQWMPADPPGAWAGTLGGVVGCGVSGPLQGCYGAVRDNVLGLEVVTGRGRVLRVGGRVVKNVAGYDLVRLFTGSRGSLGVITSVSVRLFPLPGADVTLCFAGEVEEVPAMAAKVRTVALPVAAAEAVAAAPGAGREMELRVRVLGGDGEVEDVCSRLVREIGAGPGRTLRGVESRALHRRRAGWEDGSSLVVRLAALPDRLAETLARARGVAGRLGGEVSADVLGGLVRVKGSPGAAGADGLAGILVRTRLAMEEAGGTMTLSRARPELGARVGWTGSPDGGGPLAERIKSLFDPRSILSARCP